MAESVIYELWNVKHDASYHFTQFKSVLRKQVQMVPH